LDLLVVTASVTVRTEGNTERPASGGKIGRYCPDGFWMFMQMPAKPQVIGMVGRDGIDTRMFSSRHEPPTQLLFSVI
jgi:hypothetical protein